MKRRTWIIRVGDHWFLRHIRDLYETLASKYTTRDQHRGIQSIFRANLRSPFWFRESVPLQNNLHTSYFKDNESRRSFSELLDTTTELKIYIAGHCDAGMNYLRSLETTNELDFTITAHDMAAHLNDLFRRVEANPTADKPIKISMIACSSGQKTAFRESFSVQLLEELHQLGHQHILIKAPEGSISAPIFGIKMVEGRKFHYYLGEGTIYSTEKANDLRKMALKVFKVCHTNTHVDAKRQYLEERMSQIKNLGYTTTVEQLNQLKDIIQVASQAAEVKEYRYGTGFFMRFFGIRSQTEKALQELSQSLAHRENTYNEYKNM
ncbi:hypothetical protein Lgee_0887 [Legionella geestiana]|uniref:Uncharacterized protein n=2 Tax=Legionella geestiana TaxID=45065 RepID=A0A0W0U007_9GAMM|nr:hypothetical protein [Legionella geestiana]KTD00982.1 hypothetical protein Lgee_0887 [Legionella geestiana]STX53271.1 Uncharacterised protein [Legionella geestiana]